MIQLVRRFVFGAKRRLKRVRKKNKPEFSVYRDEKNVVFVSKNHHTLTVDISEMDYWDALMAVKQKILELGLVWTPKVEKTVRKELKF